MDSLLVNFLIGTSGGSTAWPVYDNVNGRCVAPPERNMTPLPPQEMKRSAPSLPPEKSQAMSDFGQAQYYERLGHYQKAIEYYLKVLGYKGFSKDEKANVYLHLGHAYSSLKEYDKALTYYSKCEEIRPRSDLALKSLNGQFFIYQHRLNKVDTALGFLWRILNEYPQGKGSLPLIEQGVGIYIGRKDHDNALKLSLMVYRIDQKSGEEDFTKVLNSCIASKQYERALSLHSSIKKADPQFKYYFLADVLNSEYSRFKDDPKAFAASVDLVLKSLGKRLGPDQRTEALLYAALTYELRFKDYKRAVELYAQIEKRSPASAFACVAMLRTARIYDSKLNDKRKALAIYEKTLEQFRNESFQRLDLKIHEDGYYSMGSWQFQKIDTLFRTAEIYRNDLKDLNKAFSIYKIMGDFPIAGYDDLEALFRAGKILEEKGLIKEALLLYDKMESDSLPLDYISGKFHEVRCCLLLGQEPRALDVLRVLDGRLAEEIEREHHSPFGSIRYDKMSADALISGIVQYQKLASKGIAAKLRNIYSEPGFTVDKLGDTDLYFALTDQAGFPSVIRGQLRVGEIDEIDEKALELKAGDLKGEAVIDVTYSNGLRVKYISPRQMIQAHLSLEEALQKLPKEFYSDVKRIIFYNPKKGGDEKYKFTGRYLAYQDVIHARENWMGEGTILHEIMHHYDFNVSVGYFRQYVRTDLTDQMIFRYFYPYELIGDPSAIYYDISWGYDKSLTFRGHLPVYKGYSLRSTKAVDEFVDCDERRYLPSNQQGKVGQAVSHAMESPEEDFAYYGERYVILPKILREKARAGMKAGVFEPAVKYLFIKYMTPFRGKEFEVNGSSPGLGVKEVREALDKQLAAKPGSVRETTVKVLSEIEKASQN